MSIAGAIFPSVSMTTRISIRGSEQTFTDIYRPSYDRRYKEATE